MPYLPAVKKECSGLGSSPNLVQWVVVVSIRSGTHSHWISTSHFLALAELPLTRTTSNQKQRICQILRIFLVSNGFISYTPQCCAVLVNSDIDSREQSFEDKQEEPKRSSTVPLPGLEDAGSSQRAWPQLGRILSERPIELSICAK